MCEQLPYDEKRDPRRELDNALGVATWEGPTRTLVAWDRPPGAPAWWGGDEEASQSFLASMGVRLRG